MFDDGAGEACGGGPETQRSLPWCHCPRGKRERIARGWIHLPTITIGIDVGLSCFQEYIEKLQSIEHNGYRGEVGVTINLEDITKIPD